MNTNLIFLYSNQHFSVIVKLNWLKMKDNTISLIVIDENWNLERTYFLLSDDNNNLM